MMKCDRPARCRHDRDGHCCICLDCARFEREPDWCIRCGREEKGIGWNNVCTDCRATMGRISGPQSWDGESLQTFAYQLAGALSTILMAPDEAMPTEKIQEMVETLLAKGSL